MTDYQLNGAIKDAAGMIARAIEMMATAQITVAKINANAQAEAADNMLPYDAQGNRSPSSYYSGKL